MWADLRILEYRSTRQEKKILARQYMNEKKLMIETIDGRAQNFLNKTQFQRRVENTLECVRIYVHIFITTRTSYWRRLCDWLSSLTPPPPLYIYIYMERERESERVREKERGREREREKERPRERQRDRERDTDFAYTNKHMHMYIYDDV